MQTRKGFTLVELSIVLVIIGLLIGGVLKGKSMIDNTKQKRLKSDVDGIVAATYNYQDKFGFLPGDDTTNLTAAPLSVAGCAGGNGNGVIDTAERICAWRALIATGFISGDKTKTALADVAKKTPFGSTYELRGANGSNYIYIANIPVEPIVDIDRKYDDAVYNTGEIRSTQRYTTTGRATNVTWYAF